MNFEIRESRGGGYYVFGVTANPLAYARGSDLRTSLKVTKMVTVTSREKTELLAALTGE